MASEDIKRSEDMFFKFLFMGNVAFTILITITCVFLFILGMNSLQLLGSLLFLTMMYLLLTAYWSNEIRTKLAKERKIK